MLLYMTIRDQNYPYLFNRTFLVIPELSDEVSIWECNHCKDNNTPHYFRHEPCMLHFVGLFTRLKNLEYILGEMYTNR